MTAVLLALLFLLGATLPLELGAVMYGGVRIDRTHLRVGRMRSVALAALDLDTLRDEAAWEIYAVFGQRNVKSNPMWLPDTVALTGHDHRGEIAVIVKTARRDELVAALREGVAEAKRTAAPGVGPHG